METEIFQIFWHFDCVQKNPKGSFYELRKGLLHAMCSRIKIKAFLVPKCIKGEKTLKLCRSLVNHFGLRSILKKHSRFVLFVCLWLWRQPVFHSVERYVNTSLIGRGSSMIMIAHWILALNLRCLINGYTRLLGSKTILICSSSNCNSCVM